MNNEKKEELKVFGATIHGFSRAYINLEIIAGSKVKNLISDVEVNGTLISKNTTDFNIKTYPENPKCSLKYNIR